MAQDGRRPGGLTALAVLNFVWGGMMALGVFASVAAIAMVRHIDSKEAREAQAAMDQNQVMLWVNLLLTLVTVALLIASGVGYLGLKRFLGRALGNVYAIVGIASVGVGVAVEGMNIGTIIFLVYPLLTLVLLNTTFRDDFVR